MNEYEEIPVLPETPAAAPRSGIVSAAVAILVLLGFLFVFSLTAERLHDPRIFYLSEKVETVRLAENVADVVFLGTSVIHRNIDARYLNERAAADGCGLTFLNLGLPAMSVAEFKLLTDALAAKPNGPRAVVFHPTLYDGLNRIDSRRAAWSNRFSAVSLAFDSLGARKTTARIASMPEHAGHGIGTRLVFAKHWMLSSLRAGEAAHWLLRDASKPNYEETYRMQRERAGFLALDEDPMVAGGGGRRHGKFLEELEHWHTRVEAAGSLARRYYTGSTVPELPEADRRLQEGLLATVRATGSEPMVVFPPLIFYSPAVIDFYRQRIGDSSVLDFGFDRYPEFEDHRLWFDRVHLNREGARLFADRLFVRFCGAA